MSASSPRPSQHGPSPRMLNMARALLRYPLAALSTLVVLGIFSGVLASHLTINSNQLDLISQDLRQVHDVKRVIDMVGGSGFLMLAVRGEDEGQLKKAADLLAHELEGDEAHVRSVTYRMPVEFAQHNVGLFVQTPDLIDFKTRVDAYLKALRRFENPFFVRLGAAKAPELHVEDIVERYSHVGKKTILDDYYISTDRKMLLLLIKPRWDTNELGKTNAFVTDLRARLESPAMLSALGPDVRLRESYAGHGPQEGLTYGLGGSYMSSLDDSYAIQRSLEPVSLWAFGSIVVITVVFFRRLVPSLIVLSGMVLGTLLTMGFAKVSVGQLNMITSILGGILMGFGVDYGIHFLFRTRIELGNGKSPVDAAAHALVLAGRPALIAAIVTGGSFMTLVTSQFRGFSQFGFLAGCGTVIIGVTMFVWCASWVALLARLAPTRIVGWLGTLRLATPGDAPAKPIPRPRLLLALSSVVVVVLGVIALPAAYKPRALAALGSSIDGGVRFNYNSRALMAEDQYSVILQDEINRRFGISSDPVAVVTQDLAESRALYDELTQNANNYPTIDQVMSLYTFVPPEPQAHNNAKIMRAWHEELMQTDLNLLPKEQQAPAKSFLSSLLAEPYDVNGVPEVYRSQFYNLPETRPENRGMLTFIYPRVDLWDGAQMLSFADEVDTIDTHGHGTFHAAGAPLLFAQLARIVLFDGKMTLMLAAVWILLMHYLDFRSTLLALASVLPLVLGLGMMLGVMALTNHPLNFMNIVMLPILLGFGVSHGLYLLHRFLEGVPARLALRSVGAAVASSTLTAIAGFASLFAASHHGLKSMGFVACVGLTTTLLVSFSVLAAVLQLIEDRRRARSSQG